MRDSRCFRCVNLPRQGFPEDERSEAEGILAELRSVRRNRCAGKSGDMCLTNQSVFHGRIRKSRQKASQSALHEKGRTCGKKPRAGSILPDISCYHSNALLRISCRVRDAACFPPPRVKHSVSVFLFPSGCVLTFDQVTSRNFASLQSSCRSSCDMHRVLQQATERFRRQCRDLLLRGGRRGRVAREPSVTVPQSRRSRRCLNI